MRLIEGEFPNYRQVIPKEANIHLTLPVEALTRALRRVALLSAERSRAVKLELSTGQLCLSSNNPDVGDAREELDVDYAGDPLSIAFNARYLMDALTAVKAKEVRVDLRDESSPTQLRPTDDDDALAVIMPMRV
jgi:DNA polymerase-3 subunit beta